MDWGTFWIIAGVLAGVVAAYYARKMYIRQYPKRQLRYTVQSSSLLTDAGVRHQVKLTYDGKTLDDPYFTKIKMWSNSRADIASADFDSGKYLTIKVHPEMLGGQQGPERGLGWMWQGDSIAIEPQVIKPKGAFSLQFITEGKPKIEVPPVLVNVEVLLLDTSNGYTAKEAQLLLQGAFASLAIGLGVALVAVILSVTGVIRG